MTARPRPSEIADAVLALCRTRGPEGTICPSEAARVLVGDGADWRDLMGKVRQAAARLAAEGLIEVSRKGSVVDIAAAKGPIRLRWCDETGRRRMAR